MADILPLLFLLVLAVAYTAFRRDPRLWAQLVNRFSAAVSSMTSGSSSRHGGHSSTSQEMDYITAAQNRKTAHGDQDPMRWVTRRMSPEDLRQSNQHETYKRVAET